MQFRGESEEQINRKAAYIPTIRSSSGWLRCFALVLCVVCATTGTSLAQPQLPEPPLPIDPRPLGQLLSETEKASLAEAQAHGSKRAVEIYLKFSDSHLQAAFDAIRGNNHDAAERELDIYNKAVAEAGKETFALKDGRRTLSKKIEQTLYRQIKMLETIYRLFPSEREAFADAALKHAKQLRVQALNEAFAAGGVLKDPEDEKKPSSEPPAKESRPKKRPAFPLQFTLHTIALSTGTASQTGSAFFGGSGITPSTREWSLAQIPGDYLTEEEDNHVREAQAADARVKVFMKIADRRIKAITGNSDRPDKPDKKAEGEEREWGALPKTSRAELLRQYAKAIAECMAKLEDAYERNPKSASLPKALTLLREGTDRQLQTLRALSAEIKNESETSALREAIDQAETANKGARDGLNKH